MSRSPKEVVPPPVIDPNQRWLSVSGGALYIDLSTQTILNLIHSGELRAAHFGNTYRIDRADLDELMLRRKKTVAPYRKGTHGWVAKRHAAARKVSR